MFVVRHVAERSEASAVPNFTALASTASGGRTPNYEPYFSLSNFNETEFIQ